MELTKLYKRILAGTICVSLLSGFTGKEEYVELNGMLNGRSSSSFNRNDNNIVTTLTRGTRGEILETKKLRSGSYGIKIKVMNGRMAGNEMWVYHKDGASDLSLFEEVPQNWDKAAKSKDITKAKATRTEVEKPAVTDPEFSKKKAQANKEAIDAINRANGSKNKDNCINCSTVSTQSGRRAVISKKRVSGKKARGMSNQCQNLLMNSQGDSTQLGQYMMSTMADPRNSKYYLKSNALGSFCPRFNNLSTENKLKAWNWFWTSLGQEESSTCNPSLRHGQFYRDRNGNTRRLNPTDGLGIWTVELSPILRRSRGPECSNVKTAAGQAKCAIEIMKDTQLAKGSKATTGSKYWGPTRKGRLQRQMLPHMERFALCFQQ
ncbi:hypothetical protein [Bdellovibrio sp. HCB209]|uniref:hypothetical protein n=1 Tax=Bdellovibrio sp. HCB209 TaxID=3394354 RepID=UPI0039B48451